MLEVSRLEKKFSKTKGIFDMTFTLEPGEITALLGRNGSGKTTLINCMLSLLKQDYGVVLLDGKEVRQQLEKVALISANLSSISYMSVDDYGHFLEQYYPAFQYEDYQTILRDLKISSHGIISSLSKGDQMKVELAAGFAMHAKVLLLDEPFTNLDIYAKEDAIKHLLAQVQEDLVILVATHDIDEIEGIADRCLILDEGKLVDDFYLDAMHEEGLELKQYLQKYRP